MASGRNTQVLLAFVFLCGSALCPAVRGAGFAGGTGEPNDPYQIATAAQLLSIGSSPDLLKKHYLLTADIDLAGKSLSESVLSSFRGVFDGHSHTIRNLRIEGGHRQGLFGTIEQTGEVRNLGIVDAYIKGGIQGALASRNEGRVLNCYSSGTVTGGRGWEGGLVGENLGTIADSYSTATVADGGWAGGLVGANSGTLSRCHSSGDVSGTGAIGGLVGMNGGGRIDSSYCVAKVTRQGLGADAGGLVGFHGGTVSSSYANATVTGGFLNTGGLAGWGGGSISCCYSMGSVAGINGVGGLAGAAPDDQIASCYAIATVEGEGMGIGGLVGPSGFKVQSSYFLAPADGGGPDNGVGTSLTSAEMKQRASFKGWDFWGTDADGAADPWFMPPNAYPILAWQTPATGLHPIPTVAGLFPERAKALLIEAGFVPGIITYDFDRYTPGGCVIYPVPYSYARAGATVNLVVNSDALYDWQNNPGKGTTTSPYQIQSPVQLGFLTGHPELWNKHFVLTADLDMTGRMYTMALIAPDTDDKTAGFQGTPFRGTFDGKGFAIRNLSIRPGAVTHDYVGLFGMVAKGSRIDSLKVLDAYVEGGTGSNSYVGVLAGYNAGKIDGCTVTGVIRGGQGDGLVGANTGTVTHCEIKVDRE